MITEENTILNITPVAAEKIKEKIQRRGKGIGVRIGIRTTGCSGLAYTLEFVDQLDTNDVCQNLTECFVYVSPKHAVYLTGMTVDYIKQGLNEGFEFTNPNEKARCGCGESFTV